MGSLDVTDAGVSSCTVYTARERSLDAIRMLLNAAYASLLLATVSVSVSVFSGKTRNALVSQRFRRHFVVVWPMSCQLSILRKVEDKEEGALGSSNRPQCLAPVPTWDPT